jgi:hypothetical protein
MKFNYNDELELVIDHELKQLPELDAPGTLIPRVLKAIARHACLPWYRRAWQTWPRFQQFVFLFFLSTMFGALCVGFLRLIQAVTTSAPAQEARNWFSNVETFWNGLTALFHAFAAVGQHLGPVSIALCLFVGFAAYVSCLGLGTALVRVAVARK